MVVFLDDGVMHFASQTEYADEHALLESCYSAVDLEARGLLQPARAAGVRIIGDSDFVQLLREFNFCMTWK